MVEVMKIMGPPSVGPMRALLHSVHQPCSSHRQPTPPLGTPGHSQASLGQPLVGSLLLSPGSWSHKVLFVPSKNLFPQSCVSSVIKSRCSPKSNSLGILSPFARSPVWEISCGS